MIEAVIKRRGERERGERACLVCVEDERQADGRQDDPDVLDRRIREEPLHVALHRGEQHAEERGDQPQGKRQHAPPPDLRIHQVERDAQQPVNRGLQHHSAQQG